MMNDECGMSSRMLIRARRALFSRIGCLRAGENAPRTAPAQECAPPRTGGIRAYPRPRNDLPSNDSGLLYCAAGLVNHSYAHSPPDLLRSLRGRARLVSRELRRISQMGADRETLPAWRGCPR